MACREEGAGPGPPGGPPPSGPDGRVEALLAEVALDHRDGNGRAAVVVGRRHQPRRPPKQPGLDLRRDKQRHRPGRVVRGGGRPGVAVSPVGRGCGQPEDTAIPVAYPPGKGPHSRRGGLVRGPVRAGGDGSVHVGRRGFVGEAEGELYQVGVRPWGRGREAEGVEGAHAESFRWTPRRSGAVRQRVDAGRGEGLGTGPGGGSPQREGGAGRRARGHAQDPFSLGVRRGSRPRVAFRCGMASGRVPSPAPSVKTKGANRRPLSDRNHPVLLRLPDQPG